METAIDVVLYAGHRTVDVALYTLLPIMVVMMILMRMLEASGALDKIVACLTPLARPFGLTGLGVLAMIQISFVSFAAPIPTLALMEDRGASDRHLAAALAAMLAMAPANAVFPLAALGLRPGIVLSLSAIGGLTAAAATYWIFGCRLSGRVTRITTCEQAALDRPSFLKLINVSGSEAIHIVINLIPMLLVALAIVTGLQRAGAIDELAAFLGPQLTRLGIDQAMILLTITKYCAGSTALVGVLTEMVKQGQIAPSTIAAGSGFLLHPLDLPGVPILMSAGVRLGKHCLPALGGACAGILLRSVLTVLGG